MSNLHYKVINDLLDNNYWGVNINEKKDLVELSLKKYLIEEIKKIENDLESLNDKELVDLLEQYLDISFDKTLIIEVIHFILGLCSNLQGWSIVWWQESNLDLIDTPVVEFNCDGKWDKLITHENTNYIKIFEFVYNIFKKDFMVEKNNIKKLKSNSN